MSKVLFAIVMCVLTAQGGDWLLDPLPYRADVREDGGAWMQENGLAARDRHEARCGDGVAQMPDDGRGACARRVAGRARED